MKFGIPEILEYEKICTDEKVLIIIKKLHEARSKNAQWCNRVQELEKENKVLKDRWDKLWANLNKPQNPTLLEMYTSEEAMEDIRNWNIFAQEMK